MNFQSPHGDGAMRLRTLSMPRKAAAEALESDQAELAGGFVLGFQNAGF